MTRHFHTLDGMRGIAALAVVCGHAGPLLSPLKIPGSYLAVDFFFALSGFVICHAYEKRLSDGLTTKQFVWLRLIRFYPLYFVGCVIGASGAVAAFLGGGGNLNLNGLTVAIASGFLFLPSPTWVQDQWVVPINAPGWSLILELLVNAMYAIALPYLRIRMVAVVAAVSSIAFAFGVLSAGSADLGSDWGTSIFGLFRVTSLFSIGVLIFNIANSPCISRLKSWLVAISIVPVFLLPVDPAFRPYYDLIASLFVLPLAVLLGARYENPDPWAFLRLGSLSFALYAVHWPLLKLIRGAAKITSADFNDFSPWSGISIFIFMISLSLILDRYYDKPARKLIIRALTFGSPQKNNIN